MTLSYDVVVAGSVTTPTLITHRSTAVWDQGSAAMSLVTIADPRRLSTSLKRSVGSLARSAPALASGRCPQH